jgi:hypothetical protein
MCNNKIKMHMKDKEDELKKREEILIEKENCDKILVACQNKIKSIQKLVATTKN